MVELTKEQSRVIQDFNDRVRSGSIHFETVPCLCGNTDFDPVADVDRYGFLQKTVLCTQCGLILSNPRMTEEEYSKFYSSDLYRRCYEGDDYLEVAQRQKYRLETGQHILDEMARIRPDMQGLRVLEVGSGGGWNLLPFIQAGAQAVGMDVSPTLVDLGGRHGIDMRRGGVDDIREICDFIIMNHVFEHFLNPVEALVKCIHHLSPGGIIYMGVPNILNFGMGQLQNAHVWYFSPRTLETYCARAGLKLLSSGPAQGNHMFGIFERTSPGPLMAEDRSLEGHYHEVLSLIKKARTKESAKKFLARLRLQKPVKAVYKLLFH